jgi:hypothetical protein
MLIKGTEERHCYTQTFGLDGTYEVVHERLFAICF